MRSDGLARFAPSAATGATPGTTVLANITSTKPAVTASRMKPTKTSRWYSRLPLGALSPGAAVEVVSAKRRFLVSFRPRTRMGPRRFGRGLKENQALSRPLRALVLRILGCRGDDHLPLLPAVHHDVRGPRGLRAARLAHVQAGLLAGGHRLGVV